MELRHLRYFITVAEEGSFTRAAERLGMQQPPLSQQIRALERELGFTLFLRVPKGVELTRGGKVYLDEARAIIERVGVATARATRSAQGEDGILRLGLTTSAAVHSVVPEIIRRFRESHPSVAIEVQDGNAADLTEAVESERIDAAIVRSPVKRSPRVLFHTITDQEVFAVLASEHPIARTALMRSPPYVGLRELANEPFLLVRRPGAPGLYADLISACRRAGFEPKIGVEVPNMLTNVMLVAAGMGVSVVPASMQGIHAGSVAMIPLRGAPQIKAPITLAYRKDDNNPVTRRFVDSVRALATVKQQRGSGNATAAKRAQSGARTGRSGKGTVR
jgi:DNA-binding transcriptional LysR family regulator